MSVPSYLILKSGWMSGSRSAVVAFTADNSYVIDKTIDIWVSSGAGKLDGALTTRQSFTVPAGQRVTQSIPIDGIEQSACVDDVVVCFNFGDITGRRLLTVVKPLRIEIPSEPASGLALLVGSTVSVNLVTEPQVNDVSVEWLSARRRLRFVYDEWGKICTGTVNSSLPMLLPGIHALSARVINGVQSNEVVFVHTESENDIVLSGERKGPNKIGMRNHVGIASTQLQLDIRNQALSMMGSTAYAFANALGERNGFMDVPAMAWKCNAFVADMVIAAGGTVPVRNSVIGGMLGRNRPPLANEWADIELSIAGWRLMHQGSYVEPGFVAAWPNPLGSGHVGIVDFDGWSISARERSVNRDGQRMLDSKCIYRKPIVTQ